MGKNKGATIKSGSDVTKALRRKGCPIRNGKGSHKVAYLPNGKVLTYPNHRTLKTGTRAMIIKRLAQAGVILLVVGVSISYFFG